MKASIYNKMDEEVTKKIILLLRQFFAINYLNFMQNNVSGFDKTWLRTENSKKKRFL